MKYGRCMQFYFALYARMGTGDRMALLFLSLLTLQIKKSGRCRPLFVSVLCFFKMSLPGLSPFGAGWSPHVPGCALSSMASLPEGLRCWRANFPFPGLCRANTANCTARCYVHQGELSQLLLALDAHGIIGISAPWRIAGRRRLRQGPFAKERPNFLFPY